MIQIKLNPAYGPFVGQNLAKIRVVVGSNWFAHFYNYKKYPLDFPTIGESGTNQFILSITGSRPIFFEDKDFGFLGSMDKDTLEASRSLALIVDYVRKGVLIVDKDGVVLTADQIAVFTP